MDFSENGKMDWNILSQFLHMIEKSCEQCPPGKFTEPDLTKCSYSHLYKTIQNVKALNIHSKEEKSNVVSKEIRNEGNRVFVGADYLSAFRMYTKAVCVASSNSEEMSLAYANRSAATYALRKYRDCIRDIDRSLSNANYPDHLRHKLYERRGKCLMELSQFPEAAEDFKSAIENVLYHDKAQEKIAQITLLLNRCRGRPDLSQQHVALPLQLTFEPSPNIQCASVAVDIGYSQAMGRHIIATRGILPGDVLAIEKKYVSTLYPRNFLSHCGNCMKTCFSTIPCLTCNTATYCSEACRQSSWNNFHSVECRILPTLLAFFIPSDMEDEGTMKVHLALRIFLFTSKCGIEFEKLLEKTPSPMDVPDPSKLGFVNEKYLSDHYLPTLHLVRHLEKVNSDILMVFGGVAVYLMCLLKEGTGFFKSLDSSKPIVKDLFSKRCPDSELRLIHLTVADLLLKFVMMINANIFEIQDPISFNPVGGAIFPFYSLFNHSCNPDVVILPHGSDSVFVMATQPVKKGRQIFGNYGFSYTNQTRAYRREKLALLQHFICGCDPCLEDWPMERNWPAVPTIVQPDNDYVGWLMESVQRIEPVHEDIVRGRGSQGQLDFLVQFVTLAFEIVRLPWGPYRRCQAAIKKYRWIQARLSCLLPP